MSTNKLSFPGISPPQVSRVNLGNDTAKIGLFSGGRACGQRCLWWPLGVQQPGRCILLLALLLGATEHLGEGADIGLKNQPSRLMSYLCQE